MHFLASPLRNLLASFGKIRSLRPLLMLVWGLGAFHVGAQTVPKAMLLGSPSPETTYSGAYMRRVHQELAARVGYQLEVVTLPVARLNAEMANNKIDGDTARAYAFGEAQPQLVRVAEPVWEATFGLWAVNPRIKLQNAEQLVASGYTVSYDRGTVVCEQFLKAHLPAQRVVDVTALTNGLEMLYYGRHELHCGLDISFPAVAREQFPSKPAPVHVLPIGKPSPLYIYLQPQHAALAPILANALRKMRSDGTLTRLRHETQRAFHLPPD